jgi:hypothetical protein
MALSLFLVDGKAHERTRGRVRSHTGFQIDPETPEQLCNRDLRAS